MNRRQFIHLCSQAGLTVGLSSIANAKAPKTPGWFKGLRVLDPHAHPYELYTPFPSSDPTTPTIPMMRRVNMVASCFAALGDRPRFIPLLKGRRPYEDTMSQLVRVKAWIEKGMIKPVLKWSDIPASLGAKTPPGAIMAVEGGDAVEGKAQNVDRLYQYGVRLITVIHLVHNELGDTMNRGTRHGKLTKAGHRVVERMQSRGMIVDVAHAHFNTLRDICKMTSFPLIDSHTNPLPERSKLSRRNYTNYLYGSGKIGGTRLRTWAEMEMVAKTGGVVCTWPAGYPGSGFRETVADWAGEIALMKRRLGMKHVGLGTDGGGRLISVVKGYTNILDLPRLAAALTKAGLSRADVAAFMGGNFYTVIKRCLR